MTCQELNSWAPPSADTEHNLNHGSSLADDFVFKAPPVKSFVQDIKTADAPGNAAMQFDKGTTTLGFRFQGGIIVACDSRASQGSLISTQTIRKIIEINDYLLGTMAGTAADCLFWERHLGKLARIHELRTGQRISPAHAAKLLANIFYQYRHYGLSAGTMVAGYDSKTCTTALYTIDSNGNKYKGDLFSNGSGCVYAYGVLDEGYHWDLSLEEAKELARQAIFRAAHRDGASGGVVRIYHVHEGGWTILEDGEDVGELYRKFQRK